jgi:hypothetical protein
MRIAEAVARCIAGFSGFFYPRDGLIEKPQ